LRKASCIRVVSERIKHSLEPLHLRATISVLPIYIDIERVRAATPANREEFSQFSKFVLVASRLEPEKNVAAALRAMKDILKEFPNGGLLIAGSGSQKPMLEQLSCELGIEKNVMFLGHRTNIFSLYKIADVVLNASWYEGYGASIVEALAAGVPVVSTDVGVAGEAGAVVAAEGELGDNLIEVLKSGERGHLELNLLSEDEYFKKYKNALLACVSH
ncbi:MAG: glycosyltransferase, partial [Patescibacteria group bacterium]|nr:glycosyltransferase [Patescibacteria group bacterium]